MRFKVLGKQYNSDRCFVCGMLNDAGVKAEFFNCVNEAGEHVVVTRIIPSTKHQSYPNRMHGGVISALLDESIGRAVQVDYPDIWSVTIDLNVKFRKPVPLDRTIYIESKLVELANRYYTGEGRMFCDYDETLATATGKFFRLAYDAVFTADMQGADRLYVTGEVPGFLEITN